MGLFLLFLLEVLYHGILHVLDLLSLLLNLVCVAHRVQDCNCPLLLSIAACLTADVSVAVDLLDKSHTLSRQ